MTRIAWIIAGVATTIAALEVRCHRLLDPAPIPLSVSPAESAVVAAALAVLAGLVR